MTSAAGPAAPPAPDDLYPADLLALVDRWLQALEFPAEPGAATLVEAMRYSLLAGGKRLRPVLCLAVARSRGGDPERVLPTAAALELVHTYSLIHDDLPAMDDDTLRRGRPTCHVAYGEDVAILAGDGLFAEAFRLVLERQEAAADVVLAAARELAQASGVRGMVGGQSMDVAGRADDDDAVRLLHALKTGRLIEAAVVCGAVLSAATEAELPAYRAYAAELGLLFQIVDDILDEAGEQAELGKSPGKDRRQRKVTYVSRHGLTEARRRALTSHARARAFLAALPGDTAELGRLTEYVHLRTR